MFRPEDKGTDAASKVYTLAQLSAIAEQLRAAGKRISLCHGVFDLLHLGHVRHLKTAKEQGDVLVVTLTADRFVNKGPGRPAFGQNLRAEMMGNIACVDYVAVNDAPTASNVLEAIKPDVYVKGSDYENVEDDVTGNIAAEREAVERHGGRIHFTRDMTFSSSTLLNRYFDVYDPPLRTYLERLRARDALRNILDLIESVRDFRVLVVGDAIIDEYRYVRSLGKAAKEDVIGMQYLNREVFAGGVLAAANHVAGFCKEVEVLTALGGLDNYDSLIAAALKPNVKLTTVRLENRPTTRKYRFVERTYLRKLFEVYVIDDKPSNALDALIAERAADFDLVIVTDFGHGIISSSTVDILCRKSKFLAVNTQTNSANVGFNMVTKYPRADYVCIDTPEARLATGDRTGDLLAIATEQLPALTNCKYVVITRGADGCIAFRDGIGTSEVPAFTRTVVDTIGAGDAFLAITSPMAAAGGHPEFVGVIGNAVGAIKVGITGHRSSVEKVPLIKYLTTLFK